MKLRLLAGLVIMFLAVSAAFSAGKRGSVFESKHNLSVSGKGEIKATSETRVCIFCHTSHQASKEGPLWNHQTTAPGKFVTYESTTLSAKPEQPNGATKLCLSCHDGTIAVGAVLSQSDPISMRHVGAAGEIPVTRKSRIGTDLSGTHPVSIKYSQTMALSSNSLRWPPVDPEGVVGPDANGYVQCTSCHDPHDDSRSERYPFWKKATFDEVCSTCHNY